MGTGRKLLLADDSITIQKVVNLTFADEGLEVTTVGNGDLAVEKIEEIGPDIVLADIHMPGLNGYEVCEFVKRNERLRHIPVMLLVGSFEPFDEAEARRVGADDYLTKPFQSIRQLVSRVGALLSGKSVSDETPTKELDSHQDAQLGVESQTDASETLASTIQPGYEPGKEVAYTSGGGDAFADPSLDDGMIEATPVGANNMDVTIGSAPRPTIPLSTPEVREAEVQHAAAAPIHTQDTLRMHVSQVATENIAVPGSAPVQPAQSARGFAADDNLLDLGSDEDNVASRSEDEFILDIWDESPTPPSHITAADEPIVQYQGDVTEVSDTGVDQVDGEVVDVAPHAAVTPVHEFGAETLSVDPVMEAPASAPSYTGKITLDQLSPEVIDAIARRAVEQLSEKVVEQIAWEVVPELAERLIKRRLEEERKQ